MRTKARGVVCFGSSDSLPRLTYSIGAGCWWSQWWSACLEVKTRALSTVQGFFHPTSKRCQQVYSRKNFCLPTKLCFLLSHRGAARTPLVTRAKKAFFTYSQKSEILRQEEEGGWREEVWSVKRGTEPAGLRNAEEGKSSTHLQGSIKHNQLGACGDQVVAAMRLHEGCIHTIVWFWVLCTWKKLMSFFYARTHSQKRQKTKKSSSFSTLKIFLLCFYCFSYFH